LEPSGFITHSSVGFWRKIRVQAISPFVPGKAACALAGWINIVVAAIATSHRACRIRFPLPRSARSYRSGRGAVNREAGDGPPDTLARPTIGPTGPNACDTEEDPLPTFDVSTASPSEVAADLLILPVFEGRRLGPGGDEVAGALGVDLGEVLRLQGNEGRLGQVTVVPAFGGIRATGVLLVGVGAEKAAGSGQVRRAAQKAGRQSGRYATVASTLHRVGPDAAASAHAFAEGMTLGTYRFDRYKGQPIDQASKEKPRLKKVVVLSNAADRGAVRAAVDRGRIYGESANWARDLVNIPAIDLNPEGLAREAKAMANQVGLACKVWTRAQLQRGGFGGILGVGAGSANEPRLIELTYQGDGDAQPIAITGKGVTFDSGGLSLKPSEGMEWMKGDMGGAAATLAAMRAIALLKPKVNVISAIPSSENMPGGHAIRPGDVLHHRGGKTSEVLNTDAEGRLILADALAFLNERKPRVLIDSATLTGAMMIALGSDVYGIIGNDDGLIGDLLSAGEAEGEPAWQLPLWKEYQRHLESSVADLKNVGVRWGGAITAALFLSEFVGDTPWAHLDVAGTAFSEQNGEWWPRGATGSPARTLIRYVEDQAATNGSRPRRRSAAKRR
jgi:leucyl aminopeptidase